MFLQKNWMDWFLGGGNGTFSFCCGTRIYPDRNNLCIVANGFTFLKSLLD